MKGIQHTLFSYAAAAVFLLALWWAIALLLALPIVPTPDKVLVRLAHVFSRDIFAHAAWSLWRIAAGLSLAVCVGYPLGVLMGYFRRADRYLSPVVYLTYPIPKIALLPILMLLAGVGELSKILMIFLIIVFQVIVAVRDAIRTLPEERYAPLYSLGASFAQVFRFVILPASLPKFITAVRVAMATAVSAALTPMANSAKKKPSSAPGKRKRLKTTKLISTELRISSTEISIASRLRRVTNP